MFWKLASPCLLAALLGSYAMAEPPASTELSLSTPVSASDVNRPDPQGESGDAGDAATAVLPVSSGISSAVGRESTGVRWWRLGGSTLTFLAVMNGFRWVTEAGTRYGG